MWYLVIDNMLMGQTVQYCRKLLELMPTNLMLQLEKSIWKIEMNPAKLLSFWKRLSTTRCFLLKGVSVANDQSSE